MPGSPNNDWRQYQYFAHQQHSSMPISQWVSAGLAAPPQMGGMQDMDLRMFQHDSNQQYGETYSSGSHGTLGLPSTRYLRDSTWRSDIEMNNSSAARFSADVSEHTYGMNHNNFHLQPPQDSTGGSASMHSPQSSLSGVSPCLTHSSVAPTTSAEPRPALPRSATAPESRRARASTNGSVLVKCSGSDEGVDDYVPREDGKPRGRKRQRIPHTAVERRYRENLNAHLDRLRLTIPVFNRATKAGDTHDGTCKPSKCEVLTGAIEHITALQGENAALKNEIQMWKARYDDVYANPPC